MRFLRMRPAVCAMISCSFSSLTRKVAFGSNSITTPGNSSSSSFAIRCPDLSIGGRNVPNIAAEIGAEPSGWRAVPQLARRPATRRTCSFVAGPASNEALAYSFQKLVANRSIGIEPLLAGAFGVGRIDHRPIFDIDRAGTGEFERPVVGFG